MAVTLGVDTSSYQDPTPTLDPSDDINWSQVERTAYDFAVIRMSIGRTTRDVTGRRDLASAIADGIPVVGGYGVVAYAEPVTDGAQLLLDEMVAAGADPHQCLVMLDAEDFGPGGPHPTIGQVERYALKLHDLLGRWPVAYVPGWWLAGHGYTVGPALAECPWAASRYFGQPWTETRLQTYKPGDLHGFKRLAWLQYASSGTVSGVQGRVDLNCFYGTLTQLRAQLLGQEEAMSATGPEAWEKDTADRAAFRRMLSSWYLGGTLDEHGVNNVMDLPADFIAQQPFVQGIAKAAAALQQPGQDPAAVAALLAGQLEITGIQTDPGGVVKVTFGPKQPA